MIRQKYDEIAQSTGTALNRLYLLSCNNAGARMLAKMGWQPGQGLGRQPGSAALVLPRVKWDKGGLGSSAHVKRLGAYTTRFRCAGAEPAGAALQLAAASSEV